MKENINANCGNCALCSVTYPAAALVCDIDSHLITNDIEEVCEYHQFEEEEEQPTERAKLNVCLYLDVPISWDSRDVKQMLNECGIIHKGRKYSQEIIDVEVTE